MPATALKLPSPDEQILARQAFRRIQRAPDDRARRLVAGGEVALGRQAVAGPELAGFNQAGDLGTQRVDDIIRTVSRHASPSLV